MGGTLLFIHLLLMTLILRDGNGPQCRRVASIDYLCLRRKRMFETLFFTFVLGGSTVWAASPSSSFGISAPAPITAEALDFSVEPTWTRVLNRSAGTDRSPLASQGSSPSSAFVSTMTAKPQAGSSELCDKLNLTPRQKQMCVQGGEGLAETLLEAIRMSAYTCQQQFEYERWNCTLSGYSRLLTLKKAYRETSVLYAFSAAGIAHAVARACAAGRLRKCHCAEAENETETRETWRWGGCGDNLAYARTFANKFLDAGPAPKKPKRKQKEVKKAPRREKAISTLEQSIDAEMEMVTRALRRGKRSVSYSSSASPGAGQRKPSVDFGRAASNGVESTKGDRKQKTETQRQRINRHSNAVGIQVVEQLVNRTCKCHGVSGSCSIKTCWHKLAAFTETAVRLKNKYDNAVQVGVEIRENSSHLRTARVSTSSSASNVQTNRIVPQAPNRAKKATGEQSNAKSSARASVYEEERYDKNELTYQQRSPDFCVANPLTPGTRDRRCLKGENCDILCCGRGYNIHRLNVSTPCQCKLILCCKVECQTCLTEKTIYTCK